MKKKFPKKIYVKWFQSDGECYMTVAERPEELAENVEETLEVGVYELTSAGQVVTQPTFWLKGTTQSVSRTTSSASRTGKTR